MRTLFLNPPSFEGFDGGASSRWPASREIESYWYPVWLCYPAGMLPDSKVVDAPPHNLELTPFDRRQTNGCGASLGVNRVGFTMQPMRVGPTESGCGFAESPSHPQTM